MSGVETQPVATYRVQFNRDFRLRDARDRVDYFSRLGVTHLYASPILRAREGSTHGYDVVDPRMINPALGDETDLVELATELQQLGLRLILDIVPNHMAAGYENPYWRDVLAYGARSPFARWFDIDWRMPDAEMWGRVLVPVLGEPRSRVIEKDQLRVVWKEGRFLVRYFDHVFPVAPATVPAICEAGLDDLTRRLEGDLPTLAKIGEILGGLKPLAGFRSRRRRGEEVDRDETENRLAQFAQLVVRSPRIQEWANETAATFGRGTEGRKRLTRLLDRQAYRLVYWRRAAHTINYRRFFDINDLISIRQEDPQVFRETHATLLRWFGDGLIDGMRVDHIDGLRDPLGYLQWLADALDVARPKGEPALIFVEKILAPDEQLCPDWPVSGSTGYEYLSEVEAILICPRGFDEIERDYRRMLRRPTDFSEVATRGKRRVLRDALSAQVARMADLLQRLVGRPEVTKDELVNALTETMAALPVYRTYVNSQTCRLSEADRGYLQQAVNDARLRHRAAADAIAVLEEVFLLAGEGELPDEELRRRVGFIERFQQLTGPAAAKGVEDTALYAYVPLVSLNEVGGEPRVPPNPVEALHRANAARAEAWPKGMLAVTTHDTKRTADVRARLDVLSEMPSLWWKFVRRWQRLNRDHRTRVRGKLAPDAVAEYLFYQTVVGIWPPPDPQTPGQLPPAEAVADLCERLENYMLKAVREAKTRTSWTQTNEAYENAVLSFVRACLHSEDTTFLREVQDLVARLARPGFWNSLSRTVLQFTAPGTPDLYQGDEIWNFALVDPDNRRPVDFSHRRRLLDEVIVEMERSTGPPINFLRQLIARPEDGRVKLHVVHHLLRARHDHPGLFTAAVYHPLQFKGPRADHLFGFLRTCQNRALMVVVPRLTTSLVESPAEAPVGARMWRDDSVARLPEALKGFDWESPLTRQRHRSPMRVSQILEHLPVAVLIGGKAIEKPAANPIEPHR